MIDIYVINLEKDVDRLEKITEALKPNQFTRIQGVYGKDLDVTQIDDVFYTSQYLTPKSAIGCALSHRKALSHFLQHSNKDYVLILEDDFQFTISKEEFENQLQIFF